MTVETDARSTGGLLAQLAGSVTELFRKEAQLLRTEVSDKLNNVVGALGLVAAGMVIAVVALDVFVVAIIAALVEAGFEPGVAALIVGGVLTIVALVLVVRGARALKLANLTPSRTLRNVQRDVTIAKEAVQ